MLLFWWACSGVKPVETPAPEPTTEPAPAPAPEVAVDPALVAQLGEGLAKQVAHQRAAFDNISTLEHFVTAFDGAATLSNALQQPLQAQYDKSEQTAELDLDWLLPSTPALMAGYFAEGTAIVLMMQPEPWAQKAKQTPASTDDDFLRLAAMGYDNPGMVGWPSWNQRNWDYGGCSTFGSGQHLQILQEAQRQLTPDSPFAIRIQQMRDQVLDDILNASSTFAYCDVANNKPTPKEKLAAEAGEILKTVTLSAEERSRLEARIKDGFPLSE